MRKENGKKNGFTLIEVLVAATIITLLATIGIVSYSSANKQSRDARRKADIEQLRSALEMYRADNGSYVSSGGAVISTSLSSLVSTYMPELPSDPKSSNPNYYYANIGASTVTYCLYAALENTSSCAACGAVTGYNYCVKNP